MDKGGCFYGYSILIRYAVSDKLLDFLSHHIHAADDHYVRWKWAVGSVAMWDNR